MQVAILSQAQWQPLLAHRFNTAANDEEAQRALAVLRFIHERHIGLPPDLAVTLARGMAAPSTRLQDGIGGVGSPLYERLSAALAGSGLSERGSRHSRQRLNTRLWALVPPYLLLSRIILPLAATVCRAVGWNILFGAVARGPADEALRRYDSYCTSFHAEFDRLLVDEHAMTPMFWKQNAYAAYGAALRMSGHAARPLGTASNQKILQHGGLPEADGAVIAYLERVEPDFSQFGQRRRSVRLRRQPSPRRRQGLRPKEGGVEGIRQTRSLEDLEDAVFSEHVLPPIFFIDRLLHEGFLARHRPPRRWPRRDALFVGLMPAQYRSESDRFAKVTWLDAMCRLGLLLRDAGYENCDLRWIEAIGAHRCALSAIDVAALPKDTGTNPWALDRHAVIDLVVRAGWLPGIIERLATSTLPNLNTAERIDNEQRLVVSYESWLAAAMRLALAAVPGGIVGADRAAEPATSIDDYGVIHAFVFVPDDGDLSSTIDIDWSFERIHLLAALGLETRPGHSVSLCITPPALRPGAAFPIWPENNERRRAELDLNDEVFTDQDRLNRAAGTLVTSWLDIAVEAFNGQ